MDMDTIILRPVEPERLREGWIGLGRPVWASGPRLRNVTIEVDWRGAWPPPGRCTLDDACAQLSPANARLLRRGYPSIPQRICPACGQDIRAGMPVHRPYLTDRLLHAACAGIESDYLAMPSGQEAEYAGT